MIAMLLRIRACRHRAISAPRALDQNRHRQALDQEG
jgi:hypothetical protein